MLKECLWGNNQTHKTVSEQSALCKEKMTAQRQTKLPLDPVGGFSTCNFFVYEMKVYKNRIISIISALQLLNIVVSCELYM